MAGLMGIGLSGILSHQTALNTTANNITNANTEGYSRQEVLFSTQEGQYTGAGTIGSGVTVDSIRRLADEYLNQQIREDTSLYGEQNALNTELSSLDNLLAGESTGLSDALNNFFAALQNAAEDPTSLPQRQLVLSEAQQVVNRFQSLNEQLVQQRESVNGQMQQAVDDANTLLQGIAELNLAISESPGLAQGNTPNELLDQRDEMLRQLSELVSIRVTEAEGSQVNVSLSNGVALVTGGNASVLGTQENATDPLSLSITVTNGGRTLVVDDQITGGTLGGLRRFEEEALQPAFDDLGRIALALSDAVNQQHEIGMDLEGDLGGLFFSSINDPEVQRSRVIANANNQEPQDAQFAVEISDTSALESGRWILQFGENGTYEVLDADTGDLVTQGRLPSDPQAEINMPGFNIRYESGTIHAGDSFLIDPARNAAADIELEISREEDLALASPIRATTADDNLGTGVISQGTMLNVRNPLTNALLPGFTQQQTLANGPLEVVFSETGGVLEYTVKDASGTVVDSGPFVSGQTNTILSADPGDPGYQGFQFEISGEPEPGDQFFIEFNAGGISDNRNAQLLAALGTANTMNGGTQSFSEGYAGLVEDIGVKTRQSQLDLEAGTTLLEQSSNQRESLSGVNLDEEAGKLIQYQAAYTASAQVIAVAQDLFDTLLQSFR